MGRTRRPVLFGDILTIHTQDLAFVSASGVSNSCRADLLEPPVQMPPNLRDCRVQIRPQCRYSCRMALKKMQVEGFSSTGRAALSMQHAVEAEDEQNNREFDTMLGTEVCFGSAVQLMHLSTGKYLTVSDTIAKLEKDCLRVSLADGDDGSCWSMCPTFKFQKSGDPLVYQDDFYLEASVKKGFLHMSDATDYSMVSLSSYVRDTFEVNCAQSESKFRFSPWRDGKTHTAKAQNSRLFAGDVVSIQLRELDSVLASPAIQAQAVQKQEMVAKGPQGNFIPFSGGRFRADSIWKIEGEDVYLAGDAVALDKRFRLKHVASGLYLTISDPLVADQEILLTDEYHSPDGRTLWEFSPVDDGEKQVSSTTPMYIRNSCSNFWLQASKAKTSSVSAICLQEKDMSEYVYVVHSPSGDDTATIDRLRTYRLQFRELIAIVGSREDISDKLAALKEYGEPTSQGLGDCIRLCVGDEGSNPLILDGEASPESQHLMQEMGILETVAELIKVLAEPFLPPEDQEEDSTMDDDVALPAEFMSHLQLAYWLLKQVCKKCKQVKRMMVPNLVMFARHVPLKVYASDVLREIFKDNRAILTDVPADLIKSLTEGLSCSYVRGCRRRNLAIFEAICICEGSPVPFVQNNLIEFLVMKHGDALPKLVGDISGLRIVSERKATSPIQVDPRDFMGQESRLYQNAQNESSQDASERLYLLMLCALEFFAALAGGRNGLASQELQRPEWNLSCELLVSVVQDSSFPSSFRKACLMVTEKLYIDHGDVRVLPAVNLTRVWSEAQRQMDELESQRSPQSPCRQPANGHDCKALASALSTMTMGSMVEILISAFGSLNARLSRVAAHLGNETNDAFTALGKHIEDVYFAAKLIDTLWLIATFGLLKLGDEGERQQVRSCTNHLIDFISLPITSRAIQHTKITAFGMLERLFNLRLDFRLTRVFEAYESHNANLSTWDDVFQDVYNVTFERPIISERVVVSNNKGFVDSLLNIVSSSVELDVKSTCLSILFRHTTQRAVLVRELKKVRVLALPEAVKVYQEAQDAVRRLGDVLPRIASSREEDKVENAKARATTSDLLEMLLSFCTVGKSIGKDADGYSEDVVTKHQDVFHDLGVADQVLQILQLPLRRVKVENDLDDAMDTGRRDVFQNCYSFLAAFVSHNTRNQELLFKHITLFTSHIGVKLLDASTTIAAVMTNHAMLVQQVQEKDLRIFTQAITKYGKRARWLNMMRSVLSVNGSWVRRNQSVVMGLLLEAEEFVMELDGNQGDIDVIDAGDEESQKIQIARRVSHLAALDMTAAEGTKTRVALMAEREQDKGMTSFLLYHTTCINVLSACCGGRNKVNQSKCRNLLALEKVMSNILTCHHNEDGFPHPGIQADTVRFIREPFLKLLHTCFVDAAPHELFQNVDGLWGVDGSSLANIFLQEARSICDSSPSIAVDLTEQANYLFRTCLPLFAGLVKGFATQPLPESVQMIAEAVAECCQKLESQLTMDQLTDAQSFFSTLDDIGALSHSTVVESAMENMDEWIGIAKGLLQRHKSASEENAVSFREGFKSFTDGFASKIGVNPAESVGSGLKVLVNIIAGDDYALRQLSDVIILEAKGPPEVAPFLLSCIRAVRGYLCGISPEPADEHKWVAFLGNEVPEDDGLRSRQDFAAKKDVIRALAEALSHSNSAICREALLAWQALFADQHGEPETATQTALLEYIDEESQRRHFVSSCVVLLRKSVQDLVEREKFLAKRREQRQAKKRAASRRANRDQDGMSDLSSTDTEVTVGTLMDEDDALDTGDSGEDVPSLVESGHTLELLSVLSLCLQGGHEELQNMLFATGAARALHQEDTMVELVSYLGHAEQSLDVAIANKNKQPLRVIAQAYHLLQQVIRGPNARALDALINNTDVVDVTHKLLEHMNYDGVYDELKMSAKKNMLTFILTILQNLGVGQSNLARKWVSNHVDNVILSSWEEGYQLMLTKADSPEIALARQALTRAELEDDCFLHYIVLTYLADTNESKLWQAIQACVEPSKFCSKLCGNVEVSRSGQVSRLRFRVPEICSELQTQEDFATKVQKIIYDCVGEEEDERERPALFQDRVRELIKKEMRQRELAEGGLLGFLMHHQNMVRRMPLLLTVIVNIWLVCFESAMFSSPSAQGSGEAGEASNATGVQCSGDVCSTLQEAIEGQGEGVPAVEPPGPFVQMLQQVAFFVLIMLGLFHLVSYTVRFLYLTGTSLHAEAAVAQTSASFRKRSFVPILFWLLASSWIEPFGLVGAIAFLGSLLCMAPEGFKFFALLGSASSPTRKELGTELLYVVFSLAGLTISPFFFAFHIVEFFQSENARMLLSAATLNLSKLGQAGLIIVLSVYLYAVVGFQLFKGKHAEGKCTTLMNCVINYLDGGLTGGGIHDAIEFNAPFSIFESKAFEWFLQLFVMSFLIMYVQVLLAIFSGIIIDSFGELRDRHSEVTSHLCENNHMLSQNVYWQYTNFFMYLHLSSGDACSDLMEYVRSLTEEGSSEWISYQQVLSLQDGSLKDAHLEVEEAGAVSGELKDLIGSVVEKVDEMGQRLDRMETALSTLAAGDAPSPVELRMHAMEEHLAVIRGLLESQHHHYHSS